MHDHFLIVLRHAPYGRIDAAEAVRHLNGARANGLAATLLLLDDGVYLAKTGQVAAGGWTDLAAALEQALTAGNAEAPEHRMDVYAHAAALDERGLTAEDLVLGCAIADDVIAADLMAGASAALVY
jgi:sulfur relay (sulfurtransferase) DsrF/TusC family protein